MKLSVLDMPEEPGALANWLEDQLVSFDLPEFVDQLHTVRPTTSNPPPLLDVLSDWHEHVLAGGLHLLPNDALQRLLAHPRLLLELQEEVFVRGGRYWDHVGSEAHEIEALVRTSQSRLEEHLAKRQPQSALPTSPSPAKTRESRTTTPVSPQAKPSSVMPLFSVIALAASVLILVTAIFYMGQSDPEQPQEPAVAWGWAKPGAIPTTGTPKEFLEQLADAGDQWKNKRPTSPDAVARRLLEFRQGCSALLLSKLAPLAEKDREWLRERCRAWAEKIDEHLALAESGNALQARRDADVTMTKLVHALRERAKSV